jgi:hypothetical protein
MSENQHDQSKPSFLITAFFAVLVLAILAGIILTVIGFVGPVFQASYGNFSIRTTSVGLVLTIVGSIVGAYVTARLPKHVRPFTAGGPEPSARARGWAIVLFSLVALAGIVVLVLSYVRGLS